MQAVRQQLKITRREASTESANSRAVESQKVQFYGQQTIMIFIIHIFDTYSKILLLKILKYY